MAKIGKKKILKATIAWGLTVFAVAGMMTSCNYMTDEALDYINANPTFAIEKVDEQLEYWGGDSRYVEQSYNKFLFKDNTIYDHFNVGERPARVAYSDVMTEQERENYNHVFEYLNSVFEVVNPKYKFEIVEGKGNCDIYIDKDSVSEDIGAYVKPKQDSLHTSQVESANIFMNTNIEASDTYRRYMLLHEMMHVLFGSPDVNIYQSKTFSVYNSPDVAFMARKVEEAKVVEEIEEGKYTGDCAFQTTDEKNGFVQFLPTDLSTLIALYGDMTNPENVENYKVLLQDHLQQSYKIYGDFQPYYEKGFEIPTPSQSTELDGSEKE